jgi:hypothetical protein
MYIELHTSSAFSFLDGASLPETLIERAAELGYPTIALLDRENGLLFTGDTYYPAPIWLYRPETDMDAYVASAKKLAALAPEVKLVLGAHNVPVAQPDVLPKLVDAIQAVRSGKGEVKAAGAGKAMHTFQDFKFLLAAPSKGLD